MKILTLLALVILASGSQNEISILKRNQLADFKQQQKAPNGGAYFLSSVNPFEVAQFIVRVFHFAETEPAADFVFMEVGAGVGKLASDIVKNTKNPNNKTHRVKLHLFEPQTYYCEHMLGKLSPPAAAVVNAIVTDEDGVSNIAKHTAGAQSTVYSKRQKLANPTPELTKTNLPMLRLSTYVDRNRIKHIHFMHISTGGHERRVLEGAEDLLKRRVVDVVLYDCGSDWLKEPVDKWSVRDATVFFNKHGYDNYYIGKERMLLLNLPNFYDPAYDAPGARQCIAIHKDWDSQGAYVRLLRQFNKRFYTTNALRLKNINKK